MLKASDLRIGNLILRSDRNEIHAVLSVLNEYQIKTDEYVSHISYFEGIRLIDEWFLTRFKRFEKNIKTDFDIEININDDTYLKFIHADGFYYPVIIQIPEFSDVEPSSIGLERIEFVHELQNLYHALTKQDLEFVQE